VLVYCGIPTTQQSFLGVARSLESPLLVSANSFWKNDRFCGYEVLWDIEVPLALDSGGFVAMRKYGGYRWSVQEYIDLAVMLRPVWWAAQDYSYLPLDLVPFFPRERKTLTLQDCTYLPLIFVLLSGAFTLLICSQLRRKLTET
jgi:hypothetical protein